jgi:hypothetical protein
MPSQLYDPAARAATYGGNHARYLLDLDANASTTFNFCGGMMFGVSLSPRLREHLEEVASAGEADPRQPVVYGKEVRRMSMRPEGHDLDARADNARLFHGREVRQAENAAGGGGMLIHLSFAGEPGDDAEGWTNEETDEYSGWLSDRQRRWRDGALLQSEGFETFGARFGAKAFTLHHKFYLHVDAGNNFWLSAEDGCEGGRDATRAAAARLRGGRAQPVRHLRQVIRKLRVFAATTSRDGKITVFEKNGL